MNHPIARLFEYYDLEAVELYPAEMGYRNKSYRARLADGRVANLILYKREPGMASRIQRANLVSNFLATQGLPARQTLDPRILQLRAGDRTQYGAVYGYLPGRTIPWEAYTRRHLKLLGATMSHMHAALRRLPDAGLIRVAPSAAAEYLRLTRLMAQYFATGSVQHALAAKLGLAVSPRQFDRFSRLLRAYDQLPYQQVLHLDFVRSNILFGQNPDGEPAITGLLDFEKTTYGHPVFDLARTLAFLLVDSKFKTEAEVRKYFLQSGYNKRGSVRFRHYRLLEPLLDLFLMYDFYKFLRHNPYDYLTLNEHFMRTRNLLLRRDLIAPTVSHKIAASLAEQVV